MIAALYMAVTFAFQGVSFGSEQFRASEMLLIVVLINPKNMVGIILGTLLSNGFSPVGIVDVVVGTFATYLALILMNKVKIKWLSYMMPSIVNGIIIGLMLNIMFDLPLLITMGTVFASEMIVTFVPWILIGDRIIKNDKIIEILG